MSLALADFEDADRSILEKLYEELLLVLGMLRPTSGHVDGAALKRHCGADEWRSLMRSMKVFGQATYDHKPSPDIRKVMHDLRGGPLAVLLLRLQTVGDVLDDEEAAKLSRLAHDHIELMRACVRDLGGDGAAPAPRGDSDVGADAGAAGPHQALEARGEVQDAVVAGEARVAKAPG
jgi:hypothetical protein